MAALSDERGQSMVELLVAIAVITIVLSAFLAALSAASLSVAVVRERVTAENLARKQLECIQDLTYIENATPITYTTACTVTHLSSYPMDVSISYWDSSAFTANPADDAGMQWITVTIRHKGEDVFAIGNYKAER